MSDYPSRQPTRQELDHLAVNVLQRKAMYDSYAQQWQKGVEEKHNLRFHEIIIQVVREFYGRIVEEAVRQLRTMLNLD
jgi:hypothetical protein